jgi:hypothetical protein
MPIAVSILTLFPVSAFAICGIRHFPLLVLLPCLPIVTIFLFLFLYSYFSAVCLDPGLLPYNWIETRRFWYSWQDQLTGLATTPEQVAFAKIPENRPPGCSFSQAFGRFVIRGDHICGWVANWVGKRNHKQFMLLNLYGCLLAATLFGFSFAHEPYLNKLPAWEVTLILVSGLFEAIFGLMMGSMFISTLVDLSLNTTKIQRMRQLSGRSYGCMESMREVCGTGSIAGWFWPSPAFDETLVLGEDDVHEAVE